MNERRPIPEVDGTSMFDSSAACTGQDRSVGSRLRAGMRRAVDPDDGGEGGGGVSRASRAGGNRGHTQEGEFLPLYPDTRMCLIWQKLQMLNCCRAEVVGEVDLQPSPSTSPGVGGSAPAQDRGDEDDADGEDEETFFDSREYYQTSEDEDCFVGAAEGRNLEGDASSGSGGGGAGEDCDGNGSGGDVLDTANAVDPVLGDAAEGSDGRGDGESADVREEEEGASADDTGGDRGGDSDGSLERRSEGAFTAAAAAEPDVIGESEGSNRSDHDGSGSVGGDGAPLQDARQAREASPASVRGDDASSVSSGIAVETRAAADLLKTGTEGDKSGTASTSNVDSEDSGSRCSGGSNGAEAGDRSIDAADEVSQCDAGVEDPGVAPAAIGAPSVTRSPNAAESSTVQGVDEASSSTLATETATTDQREVSLAPAVTPDEESRLDEGGKPLLQREHEGKVEALRQDEGDEPLVHGTHKGREDVSRPDEEDEPLVQRSHEEREEGSRPDSKDKNLAPLQTTDDQGRERSRSDDGNLLSVQSTDEARAGGSRAEQEGAQLTQSSCEASPRSPSAASTTTSSTENTTLLGNKGVHIAAAVTSTTPLVTEEPSPTATAAPAAAESAEVVALAVPPENSGIVMSENAPPVAPETPRPDVATGDEPLPSSTCRLLGTGMTMRLPQLEESGPVTGDMLRQQGLGQAAAYRGREVLLADMKAFRAANDGRGGGGAVFADFVRWYRPECWQEATSTEGRWVDASDDRAGGSAADDKRLAWPGQGQVSRSKGFQSRPQAPIFPEAPSESLARQSPPEYFCGLL
ncbi:unnamed protein product [Scytosiphon promiscuus]